MSAKQLQYYQVALCLCLCFVEQLAQPYEGSKQCNRPLGPFPRKNHVQNNAVTCGHTHHPEDTQESGIRYINTGTWTDQTPCPYLWISGDQMGLNLWPGEEQTRLEFK